MSKPIIFGLTKVVESLTKADVEELMSGHKPKYLDPVKTGSDDHRVTFATFHREMLDLTYH